MKFDDLIILLQFTGTNRDSKWQLVVTEITNLSTLGYDENYWLVNVSREEIIPYLRRCEFIPGKKALKS